jgi:hypothetical protein
MLNKPQQFRSPCLVTQNTPYMFASESAPPTTRDGGVLGKGQLVWTCEVDGTEERPHSVTAFVEDLGLISLDPRSLMRAGSFTASRSGYLPALEPPHEALAPLAAPSRLEQLQK